MIRTRTASPGRVEERGAQVIVRPGRGEDAARLTAIAHAAKAHWGYPPDWLEGWREQLTVTPASLARLRVIVAEDSGEPVGFGAVAERGDVAEIEHLWVDPPAMGRGIGGRLLEELLCICRAGGASRARVVSDPNAAPFYRRFGAIDVGNVPSTPAPRRLPLLEFRLRGEGP
jgi:GNAT superfamily N-acetyltransferase